MSSNGLNTQNNYIKANIELNNCIVDVTIPFTNELADSINNSGLIAKCNIY